MTAPASGLRYLVERPISPGSLLEVAPGVLWLRMPLPIDLDHINLWLLRDDEGWSLVDTGYPSPRCSDVWNAVLGAAELEGLPLRRILLTHSHPDHIGLAGWLQQRCGTEVWLSTPGQRMARIFAGSDADDRARNTAHLVALGLADAQELLQALGRQRHSDDPYPLPRFDHAASDGERIMVGGRTWDVIETWGHIDGHHAFHCRELQVLVSGDHVLPAISPNVSYTFAQQGTDPLGDFMAGLRRFAALDGDPLVLPAHGRPFRGLRQRATSLLAHHEQELQRLQDGMNGELTPAQLTPLLFGERLPGFHRVLAVQECAAHLEHLVRRGGAERIDGSDGLVRYRRRRATGGDALGESVYPAPAARG